MRLLSPLLWWVCFLFREGWKGEREEVLRSLERLRVVGGWEGGTLYIEESLGEVRLSLVMSLGLFGFG